MLPSAKRLAGIIDEHEIDIIHFHWTNDMYIAAVAKLLSKRRPVLMQACDVIVLATDDEPFGLVLIEAMQVKTAVIGTANGGVVEIIDDGINGLLIDVKNSSQLREKIEYLKNNPDVKKKLEESGYQTVLERFDNKIHFENLLKVYYRLINITSY